MNQHREVLYERQTIRFHVQPTPTYDDFQYVTLGCRAGGDSDIGGCVAMIHQDVTVEDARVFAQQILNSCDIVDQDRVRGLATYG